MRPVALRSCSARSAVAAASRGSERVICGRKRPSRNQSNIVRIAAEPEIRERMSQGLGLQPVGSSAAEFGATMQSDLAKWGGIIRRAGVTMDK